MCRGCRRRRRGGRGPGRQRRAGATGSALGSSSSLRGRLHGRTLGHPGPEPATNVVVTMPVDDFRDASDAILVVAVGRYRQEALAEAYRRHAGAVFALSRRLLVDRAMAEEVVQEVFLRLWHQPDKFDPERGSLRSFLLAQTHG